MIEQGGEFWCVARRLDQRQGHGDRTLSAGTDAGERQVGADRHCLNQAVALAILRHQHQAPGDALGDAEAGDVGAFEQDASAGGRQVLPGR